jgi:hypothetical protein
MSRNNKEDEHVQQNDHNDGESGWNVRYPNLSWAFSGNKEILGVLMGKYPPNHNYWKYLNELVSDLKAAGCKGIPEKMADTANNSSKFSAAVSELEIARVLIQHKKSAELLPDGYMGKDTTGNLIPSPDISVQDETGDYYVEVSMFSDDETSGFIIDELRSFLADSKPHCRVDVSLPRALSIPASRHDDREVKYAKIREVVEKFKEGFARADRSKLPLQITVDDVVFDVSPSNLNVGYPGLINTDAFVVPTKKFVGIIRERVTEKAEKRSKWTGDNLRKRYIIAIDSDLHFMDDDELSKALIDPCGCFITDSLTSNVSGVLLRVGSKVWFVPNPFADAQINDPNLVRFLDGP